MTSISEADWEQAALETLAEPLLWEPKRGDEIAPGTGERETWDDLLIRRRLLDAMRLLNPDVPVPFLQQAVAEIASPKSRDAITENHRIHEYLVGGYPLSFIDSAGVEQNPRLRLLGTPDQNDWLAVNQVTLRQGDLHRRFDIVLYVNGMPLSIVELKKAGSAFTGVAPAHAQLQTYLREFPTAFRFCVFTLASDGIDAKYGTPFTPLNHFAPWNVDDDGAPLQQPRIESGVDVSPLDDALNGLYNQERFLQLVRSFTAFDEGSEGLVKRIAKPHQYFAVTKAVGSTIQAVETNGKAGVVWHTQGSGKSMEMELYTNLVSRHPKLKNPTIIVVTDRNELDGQLFRTFDRSLLLAEKPVQVRERVQLRDELSQRITGGIYFTTLQKFGLTEPEKKSGTQHPLLTDRRNVIVIVDEAHRSHYDDLDGYARHLRDALPNATLIAFTGTPISFAERDTQAVFGDYIDIYDLTRAVDDGATVPVYFEPRLIKVTFADGTSEEDIDRAADEYTLGLDDTERARIEASVAVVNAVYGSPERIETLARDLVTHWEERRARMLPFVGSPGKALIVGGTREICARLYSAIVAQRPDWHSDALDGGMLVAYAPLADNLAKALSEYTVDDQANRPVGRDVDEAVAIATELVAQIRDMLADCDWRAIIKRGGPRAMFTAATTATNFLRNAANPLNDPELGGDRLANRYRAASGKLARAWALSSGRVGLAELHDEIAFYEEVRVWMAKFDAMERQSRDEPVPEEIERLLSGLVAEAMSTGNVLDIYEAAGLPRLSLDDLGPEFLAKAQAAPNAHLAIEALRKSLVEAGSGVTQGNLIRQRAFSERIAEIMKRYTNQQLTAAEVIAELIELAKEVAAEASRGARFTPPLSNDELAFYDAVAQNESAVTVHGEDVLAQIARELVSVMRRDVRTDWTVRDDVRAKLRSSIKRLLVKYKYPPDKQPEAIKLVMDQMESMAPRYADDRHASI